LHHHTNGVMNAGFKSPRNFVLFTVHFKFYLLSKSDNIKIQQRCHHFSTTVTNVTEKSWSCGPYVCTSVQKIPLHHQRDIRQHSSPSMSPNYCPTFLVIFHCSCTCTINQTHKHSVTIGNYHKPLLFNFQLRQLFYVQ